MAKELPYFKFEPNEWDNGYIQICTHEEKGVFIDLCSMYWSRLGNVPFKLAVHKICGGNASALQSLYDNKIFDVIDENIYIKFLSEQLSEFENLSERNRKIAKEGWEKRRNSKDSSESNASALRTQSESNAIREEEIREDEIKGIFIAKKYLCDYGFKNELIYEWLKVRKTKKLTNTKTAMDKFIKQVELSGIDKNEVMQKCIEKSWGGFEAEWIKNTTPIKTTEILTPLQRMAKNINYGTQKD